MKKIIKIEGMSCGHCAARVEKALSQLEGVKAKVALDKKQAVVTADREVSDQLLIATVTEAGYTVVSVTEKKGLFGNSVNKNL